LKSRSHSPCESITCVGEGRILLGQQHPSLELRARRSLQSPPQHSPPPAGRRSSVPTLVAEVGTCLERRWETAVMPGKPLQLHTRSGCWRRAVGLVLTPLHSPLVGVEERGQPGAVVHHKGAALGSLRGDAAVLQVQGELRAGRSCSPGCSARSCSSIPTACLPWLCANRSPTWLRWAVVSISNLMAATVRVSITSVQASSVNAGGIMYSSLRAYVRSWPRQGPALGPGGSRGSQGPPHCPGSRLRVLLCACAPV